MALVLIEPFDQGVQDVAWNTPSTSLPLSVTSVRHDHLPQGEVTGEPVLARRAIFADGSTLDGDGPGRAVLGGFLDLISVGLVGLLLEQAKGAVGG